MFSWSLWLLQVDLSKGDNQQSKIKAPIYYDGENVGGQVRILFGLKITQNTQINALSFFLVCWFYLSLFNQHSITSKSLKLIQYR